MTRVVNKHHNECYDVYIGRGSVWGNRWTHLKDRATKAEFVVDTREEAIEKYTEWLLSQPDLVARAKKELTGKILGCYCKPKACHGDVLVKVCDES